MTPASPTTAALPPFDSYIRLESIDPQRNRFRVFTLQWQLDLWDKQVLVRIWGRIGTPGQVRVVGQSSARVDANVIAHLIRRRVRHGYQVVAWQ